MSRSKTYTSAICKQCGGTGEEDSGGFTPWGASINVVCGACDGNGVVPIEPIEVEIGLGGVTTLPEVTWGDHVDHSNRETRPDPVINPFTVVVDTREQHPYSFGGMVEDSAKKYRPLVVHTTVKGLQSGDYAIEGMELLTAIERKSLADAFQTFTVDRDRFERELDRLNQMQFAAVVIEGGWEAIFRGPMRPDRSDEQSRLIGKTCYRSILAWSQRYPRVHWFPMPDRLVAERTTFRLLQRFHKDWTENEKQKRKKQQEVQLELGQEND